QLGIFPGFGGSARSTRQIGGLKAMELMLSSRQLNARQARAIGLVDEVIGRHEELYWAARRAILAGRRSRAPGLVARLSNFGPVRRVLSRLMRRKTGSRVRPEHCPAPHRLSATGEHCGADPRAMMRAEARVVGELMVTPEAAGLRHVFG